MLEEELIAVLTLQKVKGIGDIIAKKLISHCGSAQNVFKEKRGVLEKINGIGTLTIKNLYDKKYKESAEKEFKYISRNNIQSVYFQSDEYPERLKHCIDAPILLFQDGKINLKNQRIISIVGTRKMSLYGRDFINNFIEELKPYNPIIVSGFAYGVDITAHKAAIKNDLQTIGVLAHGLEKMYPKTHKKYVHQVNDNGGFFTEFWHKEEPLREHFLKRNRIVAGISEATIIVESAEKGGSLVTADIANSYSRDVFAVPGKVTDSLSKGCNALIKTNKAGILTCTQDLVDALNWEDTSLTKIAVQKQLFIDLQGEEKIIYDYLLKKGKEHMDVIALDCNIPVYKLATLLFSLEMKGVTRPLQGKLFECI
ncbi:DNA-processing protein DprA [Urechidicola croceus]|uniref:DNA protecting protein DprA n=1 Tax=Urechidicola croceus TaxID=1850246 RepID=A0A1D8P9H6_9FLAO|nr:DNA-processing protein DprA [Urechidicola croceus]AOW21193.1 DNA protecting protein DprA [Urechidicola croceus]